MADDFFLLQERRILGLTVRRWRRLGQWASIFVVIAVWGFAAYQLGADRTVAALSDARDWLRLQTIGSPVTGDALTLRRMAICIGPVRRNCVVDGDTVWVDGEKIRLQSMDAPEIEGAVQL